ncbi:glycosyltransferase family 2 protein [Marinihelvus fidelis]|uniref:glycosyltransferase family 2 protein n=1 Tax=Marinihelvus fidelis TaxID=2613842 RepID=UPI001781669E|nr:glycosyltransferase family 2 protein [Marinihelvus fidelis]
MSTVAIVVNFNAGATLARCIESLLAEGVTRIRVVDNASTDGSADAAAALAARHDAVELLRNDTNVGYASAVNAAAAGIGNGHLLIINPDCYLCPGALAQLAAALDVDEHAVLAAPMVRDQDGEPEKAAFRPLPDAWRSFTHFTGLARLAGDDGALAGIRLDPAAWPSEVAVAEAVSGACMLVDAAAFARLGGFDTGYPFHCEDYDLMYRIHAAGEHCLFVPAAGAVHVQGVSSASRPLWVHRQKHRGMQRYYRKFQAAGHALPVRWFVQAGIWGHWALTWPRAWLRR